MAVYSQQTPHGFSSVRPGGVREPPPWKRLGQAEQAWPQAAEAAPAEPSSAEPAGAAVPAVSPDANRDGEEAVGLFSPEMLLSFLSSTAFHFAVFILLALWVAPGLQDGFSPTLRATMSEEPPEFETVVLEDSLVPATEPAVESTTTATEGLSATAPTTVRLPQLSAAPVLRSDSPRRAGIEVGEFAPGGDGLLAELPQGTPGQPRVVTDDYTQALDRITQELLRLMETRKILCIWCFDQSESMKDDQQAIRGRIERVYAELGMLGKTDSDALATAVTSFGSDFAVHTPQPTTEIEQIRRAIDQVPVDPSGEEMMCRAVAESIGTFRRYANVHRRRMALILVGDESGNPQDAAAGLEPTIQLANSVRCPIYVLGREAVFGHREARVRWVHPETGRVHWLPVDRGPETAVPEQLQTEGYEPRRDGQPSGFGPYAQSRLAAATGGIFFMLPSRESNLARGSDRRYALEKMDAYKPDLGSRRQVLAEIQRDPLRAVIYRIVHDLNPHRDESLKRMNMPENFSADREEFVAELQSAHAKAERYLNGLKRGIEALEQQHSLREREPSRRWQANYDLMRAQLHAYAARTHMYRQALARAAEKMKQTPQRLPGNRRLVKWRIQSRQAVQPDAAAADNLRRAEQFYLDVIRNHPDTPWAERAARELHRYLDTDPALAMTFERAGDEDGDAYGDGETERPGPTDVAVTGPGVGAGGGGGGGGGWGAGVPGVVLVPQYRAPPPPDRGGQKPRPDKPPQRPQPSRPRPSPPPKL